MYVYVCIYMYVYVCICMIMYVYVCIVNVCMYVCILLLSLPSFQSLSWEKQASDADNRQPVNQSISV